MTLPLFLVFSLVSLATERERERDLMMSALCLSKSLRTGCLQRFKNNKKSKEFEAS